MEKRLIILLTFVVVVCGQTWVQRARVKDHTQYFSQVMQELAYGLEKLGWSNLKLSDIRQNINLQMYNWLVNGTVLYTNGFLVSVQTLEVINMNQQVGSTNAFVRGRLSMDSVTLGYDVIANLTDYGEQRYTGAITQNVTWDFNIIKNLNTGEMTIISDSSVRSGGLTTRMNYRPENQTTEVLSRNFRSSDTSAGVETWRNIIEPMLMGIVNKIDFPDICFNYC